MTASAGGPFGTLLSVAQRIKGRAIRALKTSLQRTLPSVTQSRWVPLQWGAFVHQALGIAAVARVRDVQVRVHVSTHVELNRVRTYSRKEPETLDWIDRFSPESIFFDVGANIGVYSLYAAVRHRTGLQVMAFEPESLNYSSLNQNIALNGLQDRLMAYCLAISDRVQVSSLAVSKFRAGGSHNQLTDTATTYAHKQGILALPLDRLCSDWGFPYPHYLKIDVDGLELPILMGAEEVLSHPNFRSLLIELRKGDRSQEDAVIGICSRAGLSLAVKSQRPSDPNLVFEKKRVLQTI
jgi:FkbM family methyltransferase